MSTENKKVISVAAVGMDQQGRQLLMMVFSGPAKGHYQLIDAVEKADMVIFDRDHWQADKLWQHYREQHPHLPTIIFSLTPLESHDIVVQKPLSVANLLNALKKAEQMPTTTSISTVAAEKNKVRLATDIAVETREEAFHEFCGHAPDISPDNSVENHRLFYQPEKYLQGCLQQQLLLAKKKTDINGILFTNLSEPLILLPKLNKVCYGAGFNDSKLHTMASLPMQCHPSRIEHFGQTQTELYLKQHRLIESSLELLLWKMSLWTARGRLPQDTDLNSPIVLTRWPNFTRLVVTPYALQIAALWMEKPLSLLATGELLQIYQRYVFSFYSAAHSIGLASAENGNNHYNNRHNNQPAQHQKRGLLRRLLAHITG
ncbi:hypothetical protein [Thioflexithrix psekupsensis]|uniref:Uncharacterized protein n=1 Tax=Thioflexithrix psekupsensis TaxID=1570016 RepID=A0A251X4C0_9GAMM|nr:hypothetical protein [Thioflexithrix psekupsensis]OUD12334.1 hypothetical protein TPSD3_14570 [Thioflexithrix psekupsensis]